MNTIKSIPIASTLLFATIPAGAENPVLETGNSPAFGPSSSGWGFRAALYGWATMLDGDLSIANRSAPVDVGFDDILDHLDFAAMGVFEISNGPWSFQADLFYAELGASNSIGRLDFDADMEQFMGNFTLTRTMFSDEDTRFDLHAGARVMSIDTQLDITRNGIMRRRTFSGAASETWVDPVIGFRVQQDLPNQFFLRAAGDIGGFGTASDITWQAMAGLGYQISGSSSILLGYRSIGTDYQDGGFGYDVVSHGVILGYEYTF